MKASRLKRFAWVFFALALATSPVFSQGWKNKANTSEAEKNQQQNCLNYLSDLNEQQVSTLQNLEAEHKKKMDELRTKRRSTTNSTEKNEIREEMLSQVNEHHNRVKSELNTDQQKQYDWLQAHANSTRNQGNGNNSNLAGKGRQGKGNKTCTGNGSKGKNSGMKNNGRGNGGNCRANAQRV